MSKKSKKDDAVKNPDRIVSFHNGDATVIFCNSSYIDFDEEIFVINIESGGMIKQRVAYSPKHAKRLLLLLQKKITDYEERFEKIKTDLPQ